MVLTVFSLVLDAGVVPPGSGAFPYFAAAQNGLASSLCVCLMINGFVGFQLYEDGTTLSVWLLRLCSLGMFVISGAVSLFTFKGWAGLGPTNTMGLFVVLYIFNAIFLAVYVVMQVLLVVNTLQDRWPLGDIGFGLFFLVIGQVMLYALSNTICAGASHYLDGLFLGTICNLLAVMMVYKVRSHPLANQKHEIANHLYCSTGTRSRKKISNSVLAPSRITGRSRSHSWMTRTGGIPCITMGIQTIQAACINSLWRSTGILTSLTSPIGGE
jgi:hypothetical protein